MGFKGFLATLYSPSFEKFITRRIAGGIYIGLVWLVTAAGALMVLAGLYRATQGSIQTLLIALIGAPIATLISVVVLRLVFESSIALIVIAENTTRD
jgi:hypothetical protein